MPGLEGVGNEYSPQRSYTSREPDPATGLIYYRARWYDPQLGRFISEDPIGFAAGDANLSRYVGNSTPNAVDPSGRYGIQMHFYGIYTVLRAKGWSHEAAFRVASWSQYIDDYSGTTPWISKTAWVKGEPGSKNYQNTGLMVQFHFWASESDKATSANSCDLVGLVEVTIMDLTELDASEHDLKIRKEARLGAQLHTYLDTFAHDGFTAWHNNEINTREGSKRPNTGHADAPEGGNAPDNAYNDIEKALEALHRVYDMVPLRSDSKHVPWHVLEKELRATFAAVPQNLRGKDWDEEKNIAAQVAASKALIKKLFKRDVEYRRSLCDALQGHFVAEMQEEFDRVGVEYGPQE